MMATGGCSGLRLYFCRPPRTRSSLTPGEKHRYFVSENTKTKTITYTDEEIAYNRSGHCAGFLENWKISLAITLLFC